MVRWRPQVMDGKDSPSNTHAGAGADSRHTRAANSCRSLLPLSIYKLRPTMEQFSAVGSGKGRALRMTSSSCTFVRNMRLSCRRCGRPVTRCRTIYAPPLLLQPFQRPSRPRRQGATRCQESMFEHLSQFCTAVSMNMPHCRTVVRLRYGKHKVHITVIASMIQDIHIPRRGGR
jgi:hypothetical protein